MMITISRRVRAIPVWLLPILNVVWIGWCEQTIAEELAPEYLAAWHKHVSEDAERNVFDFQTKLQEVQSERAELQQQIAELEAKDASRNRRRILQLRSDDDTARAREELLQRRHDWHQRILDVANEMVKESEGRHVAQVVRKHGAAHVAGEGGPVEVGESIDWTAGTVLETRGDGYLEAIATDGSIIRLDQNTTLQVVTVDSAGSDYLLKAGQIFVTFDCTPVGEDVCQGNRIAVGEHGVRGVDVDLGAKIDPERGTIFYNYRGKATFRKPDGKDVPVYESSMININPKGRISGPLNLNLANQPKWWE